MTVELGKRFFPRCSAVLNNIVDDDELSELANLETGSWHDRETKKQRFNEIQNIFTKAFIEDKQENDRSTASAISSSSSSTSIRAQSRLMRKWEELREMLACCIDIFHWSLACYIGLSSHMAIPFWTPISQTLDFFPLGPEVVHMEIWPM